MLLEITITDEGGVRISGERKDLKSLALHLLNATHEGHACPTFVADRAVTSIEITRVD